MKPVERLVARALPVYVQGAESAAWRLTQALFEFFFFNWTAALSLTVQLCDIMNSVIAGQLQWGSKTLFLIFKFTVSSLFFFLLCEKKFIFASFCDKPNVKKIWVCLVSTCICFMIWRKQCLVLDFDATLASLKTTRVRVVYRWELDIMVQEYQSPVRVYKYPFELVMAVSVSLQGSAFLLLRLKRR